jgi:serine/threonine-protein kinase HipA
MMHRKAADGAIDYEDFMRLSRRLAGAHEAAECFRRAVFNLLTTNRDDHGRNHSFLYDENTMTWSLAPAYDLNPSVFTTLIALHWLGSAQVPIRFTSLLRLAEIGGISAKAAREIYGQVEAATLGGWRTAATKAEVPPAMIEYWQKEMTRQTQPLRDDATVSAASAGRRKTKREAFE